MEEAIINRHHAVVQWARAHGCPAADEDDDDDDDDRHRRLVFCGEYDFCGYFQKGGGNGDNN